MPTLPSLAIALLALVLPISSAWAQQLDCQPCNDHYGRLKIGSSTQRLVTLKNTGTKTLRIRAASASGNAFTFGKFPLPVDVGAGKSIKMPVIFAPTKTGKNIAAITLTSSAKNSKFAFNVWGVGAPADSAPHLAVNPAALDFGSVTVGSSASLTITLSATGAPVTVSAAQTNSSEFTLPGLDLPLNIDVGKNIQVTVKFKPATGGTASAQLKFSSNADNSPTTVSLTGVGVATGSHSADLTWNASNDPVVGYNIYRGGATGGPYSQINPVLDSSTNFTDDTVKGGRTYYFVVTAVDADNRESAFSNEVRVAIPGP